MNVNVAHTMELKVLLACTMYLIRKLTSVLRMEFGRLCLTTSSDSIQGCHRGMNAMEFIKTAAASAATSLNQ